MMKKINYIRNDECVSIVNDYITQKYTVYRVDCGCINTISALFSKLRISLPLDPPIHSNNFDALSDSLFSGLLNIDERHICIVFEGLSFFKEKYLKEYNMLIAILDDNAEYLLSEGIELFVFIVL